MIVGRVHSEMGYGQLLVQCGIRCVFGYLAIRLSIFYVVMGWEQPGASSMVTARGDMVAGLEAAW